MFWLIGLTVFGLAMATSDVASGQPDDESELDEEELWNNGPVDELEGQQETSGGLEYPVESDAESIGNQIAEGTSGKDLIFSEGGEDGRLSEIHGNGGNDRIYASNGAEVFGGAGNDMIVLRNLDEDSLPVEVSGDGGADAFLFEGSSTSPEMQGMNTISDYQSGEDIVGVILDDESFSDGQIDGSISYSLKSITAQEVEGGTILNLLIGRELDPDFTSVGDECSTEFTHQILLKGVTEFDPKDFVIVTDWIAFSKEFLGSGEYSSVVSPH